MAAVVVHEDTEDEAPHPHLLQNYSLVQNALEKDPFFAAIRAHALAKP